MVDATETNAANPAAPAATPSQGRETLRALGLAVALTVGLMVLVIVALNARRGVAWTFAVFADYIGAIGWLATIPIALWFSIEAWRAWKPAETARESARAPGRARRTLSAGCVAVMVAGNGCLNIAASRVDKFWQDRKPHTTELYTNHDLARLVGQCVRLAMLRHAEALTDRSERAALEALASVAPKKWQAMVEAGDKLVAKLADGQLTQFIAEPRAVALNQDQWLILLTAWREPSAAPIPSSATLAGAAASIAADFGITLREALKADFEKGGKAWAAMQLDLAQEILRRTPNDNTDSNPAMSAALAEVQGLLAENAKALPALAAIIADARRAQDDHAREVVARFDDVMRMLARFEKQIDILSQGVDNANQGIHQANEGIDQANEGIDQANQGIADLRIRFDELDGRVAPLPTRLTRGNLHESAPPPNLLLTSRAELRRDLTRWATVPTAGRSLALVGEPGVNTTDIARDLAAAFDPSDPSRPTPYAEIWWFDAHPPDEPVGPSDLPDRLGLLLRQLGVAAEPGADRAGLARKVKGALATGPRSLFIIDGLNDPSLLHELLPAGNCDTLVTTLRADLAPELILSRTVPRLTADEALVVLVRQREDLRAATDDPDLRRIVTEADGNDVALELGAAFLARLSRPSARELADQLCSGVPGTAHPFNTLQLPRGSAGDARPVACVLSAAWADLKEGPELALLRVAAWCAPSHIPLPLIQSVTNLGRDQGVGAAEELARRSIVRIERRSGMLTVSVSRPIQRVLQGVQAGDPTRPDVRTLAKLTRRLSELFQYPPSRVEMELDHTRDERRIAMIPHAESVLAHNAQVAIRHPELAEAEFTAKTPMARLWAPESLAWLSAHLHWCIAERLTYLGQISSALWHIEASILWQEKRTPRDERSLAIDYASRATIRQLQGNLKGAEEDLQKSISWFEAQTPRDERSLAVRYASRARIRQDQGNLKGAEEDLQKSISWSEAQTPRDERSLAIRYASRATIRQLQGNLKGAEEDLQKSISWGEAQTPRDERGLAIWYASRASIRQDQGNLKGAEEDIEKAISWGEAQTPRDERSLAILYASRASIRQLQGNLKGAEEDIKKAIDWEESQIRPNQRELAIRYALRARIRRDQALAARGGGDELVAAALFAQAKSDIARALAWYEQNLPGDERAIGIFRKDRDRIDRAARP
jgi:hypothetical protein